MKSMDFGDIEQIKKIRNNGYRGWAIYLIPFCKNYFDAEVSAAFIQQELLELYDFQISIHTLRFIRTKYKKSLSEQSSQPNPINQSKVAPKTEIKTITPHSGKLPSREEKKELLEKAIKNMADFDNRPNGERTQLDDLIDKHQQLKNKG